MPSFRAVGIPEAQARPRLFKGGVVHSPKSPFSSIVYGEALVRRPPEPFDVPVFLSVVFVFPRPKSAKRGEDLKATKPDLDNLLKAVKDAMTHARWWTDDGRVSRLVAEKRWARDGEPPGAEIEARPC